LRVAKSGSAFFGDGSSSSDEAISSPRLRLGVLDDVEDVVMPPVNDDIPLG
jgi:hypothetical protein